MNKFLATLDNTSTPPVSGSSTTGNVIWPSPFYTRVFTQYEQEVRARLFGYVPNRFTNFVKAIQLLWLVEDSICAPYITSQDPVITYTHAQLVGQFAGISQTYEYAIDEALVQFDEIDGNQLPLSQDLLAIWTNALSRGDRLAAIITHFGLTQ